MRSSAGLQASCALSGLSGDQKCPHSGSGEAGGQGGHLQAEYIWGQLVEALDCAGSGVLVVIYPNPTQMLKIGQMNHALKVSVSADYKGSPG